MMKNNSYLKVALVTETLWKMGGANRVLEVFAKMYPQADIYSLYGDPRNLSKELQRHRIIFSKLNHRLGARQFFRYTLHLLPNYIERFDFSDYDLVISSSSNVAMGVVTPSKCLHVAYVHTPTRYLWDLKDMGTPKLGNLKHALASFLLTFVRIWEVSAANRPDIMIANSQFVADRIYKYWRRKVDAVVTPPIPFYDGKITEKKEKYIVVGAPFEFNKKGDFLLDCLAGTEIKVKLIGDGSMRAKLRRKYAKYPNIKFLENVSDKEKFEQFAHAACFVVPGVEDFGIFPLEAMSAGCPVLAYKGGGILENLKEGVNGYFFDRWEKEIFLEQLQRVLNTKWNYEGISKSVRGRNSTEEIFRKRIEDIITF